MIKCEICGKELVSIKALSQHIKNHDITSKDYYLKYIGEQKKCEECGKETIFLNLSRGFQKFCGSKCCNINKKKIEKFKESYLNNDVTEVHKKRQKTNFERYGVTETSRDKEIKNRFLTSIRKNNFLKTISYLSNFDIELLSNELNYINNQSTLKFKCKKCGLEFEETYFNISQRMYKCKCEIPHSRSNNEKKVEDFIREIISDDILTNYKIENKNIDIVIPSREIAIEYNGIYWHSELILKDPVNYHNNKLELCKRNNYRLIQIFEDEWLEKPDIVKHRLINIIGAGKKEKIYARNCKIESISSTMKNDFLTKFHLQGKDISSINLGAFYKNELVSVMTFSHGNISKGSHSEEGIWELSRFCSNFNYNIIGIASKLLSYFKRTYKWNQIFSYADRRWSDGNLYYKLGFDLSYITKPNYWYSKDGFKRIHRFYLRKTTSDPKDEPEWLIRAKQGYYRIWDAGNYKFILKNKIV